MPSSRECACRISSSTLHKTPQSPLCTPNDASKQDLSHLNKATMVLQDVNETSPDSFNDDAFPDQNDPYAASSSPPAPDSTRAAFLERCPS